MKKQQKIYIKRNRMVLRILNIEKEWIKYMIKLKILKSKIKIIQNAKKQKKKNI